MVHASIKPSIQYSASCQYPSTCTTCGTTDQSSKCIRSKTRTSLFAELEALAPRRPGIDKLTSGSIRSTLVVTPAIAHNPATDLAASNPSNPQWKMKMSQYDHTTPPILTKPWHSGTPNPPFHPDVADLCTKSAPKTPLLHTTAKPNAHPPKQGNPGSPKI
jgi:hypothetical protein